MIRLPPDHNHTSRRYARTLPDAFADSRAPCIERPQPRTWSRWALFGPIALTVATLALLNVVRERADERRAITLACQAEQIERDGNVAACLHLFLTAKGGR